MVDQNVINARKALALFHYKARVCAICHDDFPACSHTREEVIEKLESNLFYANMEAIFND